VCKQLLEEATLIAQLPIENKCISYQVAEFRAGAIPEGIRLFIDILLKGRKRYFEFYQAHSFFFFFFRNQLVCDCKYSKIILGSKTE
jgi:hypothetical protein